MSRVMVLMYHALYADDTELAAIDAEDRPYAVSVDNFRKQLDWLDREKLPVTDPLALSGYAAHAPVNVVLTFDDGHDSNYRHAYPLLRERGVVGVFFVTSDFIGRRPGFCTWEQLGEMANAGMHIGSHGKTHRFFDDLTAGELEQEYCVSRDAIASGTGRAPVMLSFPGGRYRESQITVGREAGYRYFFSSAPGANRRDAFVPGAVLRRIPIRSETNGEVFADSARGATGFLLRARVSAVVKGVLRKALGNYLYHHLYKRLHS
jgi:peptidoglycan/xylan/chitin deacetylase (PgdA/CDA1 family)